MKPDSKNLFEGDLRSLIIDQLDWLEHRVEPPQEEIKASPEILIEKSPEVEAIRLSNHGSPSPVFNSLWYLATYEDVKIARVNPLIHYLEIGWKEGRNPHPLFDTKWYLTKYKEVSEIGVEPLTHYLSVGWKEGKNPNSQFSTTQYITLHSLEEKTNPLVHYIQHEWNRNPNKE